jgi:tetratricopeptide (TPR) repeat protein
MGKPARRWILPAMLVAWATWLGGDVARAEDDVQDIGPIGPPPPAGQSTPSAEDKARAQLAGARNLADQQKPEDARAKIRKALEIAPKSAAIRIEAAKLLARMGRLEQAASELTIAIELADAPAEALDQRAWMHLRLGRFDKAFADTHRAIILDPTEPRYRWGRTYLWSEVQAPDHAAREARQALELTPEDDRAIGLWMASRYLLTAGRLDESEKLARQLLGHPEFPSHGRACLALVLAARGQTAKALEQVDKLREDSPKTLSWMRTRGLVLLAGGRFAECRSQADDLLQKYDRSPEFWSLRGYANLHLGDLDKAKADAREAIKRENWYSHSPRILLARAWYLQTPTAPEARQALDQAVKKAPQDAGMIALRYLAARQAGDASARKQLAGAYKKLYYKQSIGARGIAYLLGRIDREQLLAELDALRDYWKRKHRPGIYYMLAVQARLDGRKAEARKWLQRAVKDAPPDNFAARAARRELEAPAPAGPDEKDRP